MTISIRKCLLVILILIILLQLQQLAITFHSKEELMHNLCNTRLQTAHQKILSYSLFGNGTQWNYGKRDKYTDNIRDLARQVKNSNLYRNWTVRVYHENQKFVQDLEKELSQNEQIQFCNVFQLKNYTEIKNIFPMFWRNLPLADPSVDITCFRDLDSDLLEREEDAVNDWLKSDHVIHVMRDNPKHVIGLLGGMWCFRNRAFRNLGKELLTDIIREGSVHRILRNDQPLLNIVVWKRLKHDSMQHDAYNCDLYPGSRSFPKQRSTLSGYIGCVFHGCRLRARPCPVICRPKYGKDWEVC